MCVSVFHMCVDPPPRQEKDINLMELELQAVVSQLTWVLRTILEYLGGMKNVLSH